ncbi:MAG TPA: PA2779 family protein [Thermoanaerobaculia bacterium]|nr:PA2779 family protein [Thermoanaerobaculia bacterium]
MKYTNNLTRLVTFALLFCVTATPLFAGAIPSKTAANQSLESRAADLALIRDVTSDTRVAQALAQRGFTPEQIDQRLAQLPPDQIHQLAQNLEQIQAAGLTKQEWAWIAIAAIAVLVVIIALS